MWPEGASVEVASHLGHLEGTTHSCLQDPNLCATLELRLRKARADVEAAVVKAGLRVQMNAEDERQGRGGIGHGGKIPPRVRGEQRDRQQRR